MRYEIIEEIINKIECISLLYELYQELKFCIFQFKNCCTILLFLRLKLI